MNRIVLLIIIILCLDIFLNFGDPYERFEIVNDGITPLIKSYDSYKCTNKSYIYGWIHSFFLIPIFFFIFIFFFPIPIFFVIYVPFRYMGWHYDRLWKQKCYNRYNYGYETNDEINKVLRQRYPYGIPPVSVWGRKELWPNNFYHKPEELKDGCCFIYKNQLNKLDGTPCVKDFEMSTRCDFYANHILENGQWKKINRVNGENSECERISEIKKICCHTCSL